MVHLWIVGLYMHSVRELDERKIMPFALLAYDVPDNMTIYR